MAIITYAGTTTETTDEAARNQLWNWYAGYANGTQVDGRDMHYTPTLVTMQPFPAEPAGPSLGGTLINGTAAGEVIYGEGDDPETPHNDIIHGNGGNDLLGGNAGDDYITTGNEAVTLFGWTGNDTIVAGSGNDYLTGDEGEDKIYGNAGDDFIYGWNGNDYIEGGAGSDLI